MSVLRKLQVKGGLIWDGFFQCSTTESDEIARANDLVYAEDFVSKYDGITLWIDEKTLKVVK
jgi:hypothetical protein